MVLDWIVKWIDLLGVFVFDVILCSEVDKVGFWLMWCNEFGEFLFGDIIIKIDDKFIVDFKEFVIVLEDYNVSDMVMLIVICDGRWIILDVFFECVE